MISDILTKVKTVKDFDFSGKKVFLRADFNCPLDEEGNVADNSRILAVLPTIEDILKKGGKLIMASHLGRPKGGYDEKFSLRPIAEELQKLLNENVFLADYELDEDRVKKYYKSNEKLILLENIRFYPGETKGDEVFAKLLAPIADIYINDAFGASHRKHVSIYELPKYFKQKGIGYLIEKELAAFWKVLVNPEKPFVVIMGGAKVSDKINVLKNLIPIADKFLIGGAMSYTFLKSQGIETGNSLVETERLDVASEILKFALEKGKEFHLPKDHLIVKDIKDIGSKKYVKDIENGYMGVDIGPDTMQDYKEAILSAKTIVWNGPMGIFEIDEYAEGTKAIADAIKHSDAYSIIGGGDSVRAIKSLGYEDSVDLISTGGGASLKLLEGNGLPGVNILLEE